MEDYIPKQHIPTIDQDEELQRRINLLINLQEVQDLIRERYIQEALNLLEQMKRTSSD